MKHRLFAALLVLFLLVRLEAKADNMEEAIFKLVVNEVPQGDVFVILHGRDVFVQLSDLESAGLLIKEGKKISLHGKVYVSLQSLSPNLSFSIDETKGILTIKANPSLFKPTVVNFANAKPEGLVYSQSSSFFLNYSLNLSTSVNPTGFAEAGYSNAGNLLYTSITREANGNIIRGLTNYTDDNPQAMIRWIAGDANAVSETPLGGNVLIGGISYGRDFDLNPYFIRYPTYGFSGTVSVPSTADIYVNGVFVKELQLPPGPFNLANLPVEAGSGQTTVVLRNIYGQQETLSSPYYFSTQILSQGLSDYSYNLGFERNNFGLTSWNYGPLVFLGRYRYGFTNSFTGGAQLEAVAGLWNEQVQVSGRLPFADAELDLGTSHGRGFSGDAASLRLFHLSSGMSVGVNLTTMSPHYANSSLSPLQDRALFDLQAFLGFQAGIAGSITFQYRNANYRDSGETSDISLLDSVPLGQKFSLVISADHQRQNSGLVQNSLFASLNYFFGENTTASLSEQVQGKASSQMLQVFQPTPIGTGMGYRATITTGAGANQSASVQYQAPFGIYEGDFQHLNGKTSADLLLSGGLTAIGDSLFATRPVQEGYALVQVPDVPGVTVNLSNEPVGKTDSHGNVLVPNLLPYFGNSISISQRDIPLDYEVDQSQVLIAPPFRGGAFVRFPVFRIQEIFGSIVLVIHGKKVVPAYGDLSFMVGKKVMDSPLGEDGEFYFQNIPPGDYEALVRFQEKAYIITLHVPESKSSFLDLGTLRFVNPKEVSP
jgi:outer membrane usher protein